MFPLAIPSTPYNLANASNISDVSGYIRFANELSGGIFGWMTVASVIVITYMIMSRNHTSDAFIVAAFSGFITSTFMAIMGVVAVELVLLTLLMVAIAVGWGVAKK